MGPTRYVPHNTHGTYGTVLCVTLRYIWYGAVLYGTAYGLTRTYGAHGTTRCVRYGTDGSLDAATMILTPSLTTLGLVGITIGRKGSSIGLTRAQMDTLSGRVGKTAWFQRGPVWAQTGWVWTQGPKCVRLICLRGRCRCTVSIPAWPFHTLSFLAAY